MDSSLLPMDLLLSFCFGTLGAITLLCVLYFRNKSVPLGLPNDVPGYGYSGRIANIRSEFPQLKGAVYLDHAGATLTSSAQIEAMSGMMRATLMGNPHSEGSLSAQNSTMEVERARQEVLQWFTAPAGEYFVIFTANATAALKLVGECFPWQVGSEFRHLREVHNSVLGIREYAASAGATICSTNAAQALQDVPMGSDGAPSLPIKHGADEEDAAMTMAAPSLFAFAPECNFSGRRYPFTLGAAYHQRYSASKEREAPQAWCCKILTFFSWLVMS